MNTKITYLITIIRNIFKFSEPEFLSFDCVDYVIDNHAYFLLSWRAKNFVTLKIKPTKYISFKKSGSAYISLPVGTDHVYIIISNIWQSKKQIVFLKRLQITTQIDFNIKTDFKQVISNGVAIGSPIFLSKRLILKPLKANVLNINNQKEIINITYP